ncbi:MAG: acetyl-CoA carboxylase, biotin carboxyl carrier protein [Ignavibacteria bacterium GWF2_33_9]|nr:MAG: acetyl-CoA carboxylase, biotin carboxyl carrier protein [Ignavibacteria bacterium GWF2_33_9]
MDLNYLRRLVKVFDDSTLDDLVIEEEGTKIKFSRKPMTDFGEMNYRQSVPAELHQPQTEVQYIAPVPAPQVAVQVTPNIEKPVETIPSDLLEVKSPMVGTFYRSPSPDADPFVEVGGRINKGKTLCIIEAMKLMNQIEAEVDGTIEKILVENGKPVEFGQTLFLVKSD